MTLDLTGGMDPATDEVTSKAPTSPEYREGTSMWIWDDAGRFGFPRIGVECVGATWETSRPIQLNYARADGRVLVASGAPPPLPAADGAGRPRVLGAGPLAFRCIEPFDRWRLEFDGLVAETTIHDQIAGRSPVGAAAADAADVSLKIELEARMAAPPWIQGAHDPEGHFVVGEDRFEQLFTAQGTVRIDGVRTSFSGGGLRIHRTGGSRSDYSTWLGHCWHSALFPSGRAFGLIHYHPYPDGSVRYHEGWLLDGGEILPAKAVETPWMKSLQPGGEDVSFTLRTPKGDVRIGAETRLPTLTPEMPIGPPGVTFPPNQQGIALYQWDDERAYGMIERSYRLDAPE